MFDEDLAVCRFMPVFCQNQPECMNLAHPIPLRDLPHPVAEVIHRECFRVIIQIRHLRNPVQIIVTVAIILILLEIFRFVAAKYGNFNHLLLLLAE